MKVCERAFLCLYNESFLSRLIITCYDNNVKRYQSFRKPEDQVQFAAICCITAASRNVAITKKILIQYELPTSTE